MKKNRQFGFAQIPILVGILIGTIIISGIGYWGLIQYKNYQTQKLNENNFGAALKEKDAAIESLKRDVEKLKTAEKSKQDELLAQSKVQTQSDLPSIIKKWRPRIVQVLCQVSNWNTGQKLGSVSGSGFLVLVNGNPTVLTNKHVLVDLRDPLITPDFYKTDSCDVGFPRQEYTQTWYPVSLSDTSLGFEEGIDIDWGTITFKNPDSFIKSLTASNLQLCTQNPSLGDPIIILGYPAIGSDADITVTNGIISAYDFDHYITDAKIEHGNSGGAAISIKDDCYLGLPTFVRIGEVESLGRILKWQRVLKG